MMTVRVFLECASPTNRPSGLFDTFIALDETAFLRGAAVNIACRRAAMLGFNAPYRVVEVRRVDQPRIAVDEVCTRVEELRPTPHDCRDIRRIAHEAHLDVTAKAEAPPVPVTRSRSRPARR